MTSKPAFSRVHSIIAGILLLSASLCGQVRHDTFIHLTTNDSLDATYYVPVQAPPSKGYASIIFVHGFGFDKYAMIASCSLYAASGYMTMCFSVRGHGTSSGGSTIMATQERKDFAEVVGWFRSLPDIDTLAVAIVGGSQGGLHGLWAAADRLPVAAVSSDVIVPRWASDMLANGTIRRTALLLMQTNSTVRYDPSRDTLWDFVRTDNYDSLFAHFTRGRDVDTVQLNSSTIPTLRLLKWQDHYFGAQDGIAAFDRYAGPKKMYAGTRGHFSDLVESERVYQDDQVTRWIDHYARGVNNGIDTDPMYTYAYSSLPMDTAGYFQWTRLESNVWPPSPLQPLRLYLNRDSLLSFAPSVASDSFALHNDYLNPAYTFDIAYIEGFRGPSFDAALPKRTLSFTSPVLANDVTWIGVPAMHIFARSGYTQFPINVQLYEVDSTGNKYFVNRISYTARHWPSGTEGVIDAEGIPHAHRFLRGDRIRVEMTNIDVTNRQLLGSYPFVVPMMAQAGVTMYTDPSHPSYIEFPSVFTTAGVEDGGYDFPVTAQLSQNYPNPFNPRTQFGFRISTAGEVTVKVFDIVGREVATLVNEVKSPGEYTVAFDAGDLASGMYFYRLQTMGSVQVRKMMLLR